MGQVFVGREAELTAISQRVAAAADGHPGVVWIEGDAGFGKTALMRRVITALPADFAVHGAEAEELSREQPFGLTAQLGATTSSSPLAAGLDLLGRIEERAAGRPSVIAVEDLHWADAGSRAALAAMVRRLGREPVLLVITSRPGAAAGDGWDRLLGDENRCCALTLGPLSAEQVAQWATALGIALTRAQADRLCRHTGGHPLYLRTLFHELTPAQLGARDLPPPRSLAAATVAALAELPEPAGRLASGLAVLGQRTTLAVAARVADVAEPTGALERLLDTGLVTWSPGELDTPIDFAHPLYRRAIYDDLSPIRRQGLHLAAAESLGRVAGWPHRVAAADTTDDALADELAAGADREIDRGAGGLAAKYLLWAVTLTSQRRTAEARLLLAARLLLSDGQLDRVGDLMPVLTACQASPLLDLVLGSYAYETGDSATAQRLLMRVASDGGADPGVRAAANARLSSIYLVQGEPRRQAETATAALADDIGDDDITRSAWGSLAAAEFTLNGAPAGLAVLARRLPASADDVDGPDAELLMVRGLLQLYAAQTRAGIVDLRAAIQRSRTGYSHQRLPAAHVYLARALFVVGDWDEALVHTRAAQAIGADPRHAWIRGRAEFVAGTIAVARGQWEDAQRYLGALEAAGVAETDPTWNELLVRLLKATERRARGDAAGVVAALGPLAADRRLVISQMTVVAWWPVLVEGLIESGEIADAASQLERLQRHVDGTGLAIQGQLAGLRARLAGATGEPDEAARRFEIALAAIRPDDPLIDRGLLCHRYGRLLHVLGDRRRAAQQLRAAHQLFAGVGAEPFRLAVANDLAGCGIRSAPGRSRSPLDFTEREQDVVALVRRGMTNREIAVEMYVSEKAVEYHLRNVYAKLGVGSRRELRARLDR